MTFFYRLLRTTFSFPMLWIIITIAILIIATLIIIVIILLILIINFFIIIIFTIILPIAGERKQHTRYHSQPSQPQ